MLLRLLPGVILAEGTGKSQLADAGNAQEPGMNVIGLCLTNFGTGTGKGLAGILVPVPILVQESFGTGMGTNTKFGKSTGDWYFYQNCHNSYVLVTV
jgi:hypothetical protein